MMKTRRLWRRHERHCGDGMSYETLWSPVARIPTPPLSAMLRSSPFPVISLSPLPGSSCASWITRMLRPPTSTEPEVMFRFLDLFVFQFKILESVQAN